MGGEHVELETYLTWVRSTLDAKLLGCEGGFPMRRYGRPRCPPARMELLTVTEEAALSKHFVLGSGDIFSHTLLKNCIQAVPFVPL